MLNEIFNFNDDMMKTARVKECFVNSYHNYPDGDNNYNHCITETHANTQTDRHNKYRQAHLS